MTVTICIPFRDRGTDPLRKANLEFVQEYWAGYDCPVLVVDDGRYGDAQFNRSAAYNKAAALTVSDVLAYVESDMILDYYQLDCAVNLAKHAAGLVVPFTEYRYLSEVDSDDVRAYRVEPRALVPEYIRRGSHGAVNVVSRQTLSAVGQWDEEFDGNWYDDDAMYQAFEVACGPARFVGGPAFHLYHLPGWTGPHLTESDTAATEHNRQRYKLYQQATTPEEIRELTNGQVRTTGI